MNKVFQWVNLFFICLAVSLMTFCLTVLALREYVKFSELWEHSVYRVPFYIYIIATIGLMCFVVSGLLYYGLRKEQKRIVHRLQWLLLGQYQHPVFAKSSKQKRHVVLSNSQVIDEQFQKLSEKLFTLTQDVSKFGQEQVPLNMSEKEQLLEDERHRIARELHDSVSQQLFAANLFASSMTLLVTKESQQLQEQLVHLTHTINEAQKEMRALLLHLRPVQLEGKTLREGVLQLLEELKHKVEIGIVSDLDEVVLPVAMENHLFRMIQELLSNVLRHSKATVLEVYIKQFEDHFQLRLVDNGIGFDISQVKAGRYGLESMRERIQAMGGSMHIVSLKNQGSAIDIKLQN